MKSIIFSSGEIKDYTYLRDMDFSKYTVICADNGYSHALKLGITPDVIVGDNDSYENEYPCGVEHYVFPPEKDKTDTNIAIDYAIEHGYDEIDLYGGLGGRIDQEFSHFCLMKYALDRGVRLKMIDDINEIWMEDSSFKLAHSDRKYVSFFPYGGEVKNVCISGLKYEADNMTLSPGLVQASSNEFIGERGGEVSFDDGVVLVMLCDDRN